jgi:hypothetical protein
MSAVLTLLARAGRREHLPGVAGRVGLLGRAGFYFVLTFLTARVAAAPGGGRQANANGALGLLTRSPVGSVAVGVAAAGFVAFGLDRLYAAWHDHDVPMWQRVLTALQGAFYLALAYVPVSYLAGQRGSGSEQSQHNTVRALLGVPGGQFLVAALGAVVLGVCGWQIRTAVTEDFEEGLQLRGAPRWVRRLTGAAGSVGIAARALVFAPIGGFLIAAAVTFDPRRADGLDAEILSLSRHAWGIALISAVACGLAVFAVFSLLEARYRKVDSVA